MSDNGVMFWPATTTTAIIDPTSRKSLPEILNEKVSVGNAGNISSTVLPPIILESIATVSTDLTVNATLIGKTYFCPDLDKIRHYYALEVNQSFQTTPEDTDPSPEITYYDKETDKFYRWDAVNQEMIGVVTGGDNNIQEITWSSLRTLRNGENLIPGKFYKITDYTCTTTQTDTDSAGHVFDIIVLALSESTLSETAWADHHTGDTYFSNCKLEAWELKYCLDNDSTLFAWADTTNGKGVIYWMKDEWGNECSYDFKNILFNRGLTDGLIDEDSSKSDDIYTFNYWDSTNEICKDATLELNGKDSREIAPVRNNIIKPFCGDPATDSKKFRLNDIVAALAGNYKYFYNNIFENDCYLISLGSSYDNIFGAECSNIKAGVQFRFNVLGVRCMIIEFGSSCSYNQINNYCMNCNIGNNFIYNNLGISCGSCTFGNTNKYITLGASCKNIIINSNYVESVTIDSGNQYITLTTSQTPSSSNVLRNIRIVSGVNNTTTRKTISHDTLGDTFLTTYKPANSVEISV